MEKLKYTVIKDIEQYNHYCSILESLVLEASSDSSLEDEIDLLTLLIERYDETNHSFAANDPIELLRSFMTDHQMKAKDIVALLEVSKGYVSDILNYRKGLSKEVIRKLASHFKVQQEAFNRPYRLISSDSSSLIDTSVLNSVKSVSLVGHHR